MFITSNKNETNGKVYSQRKEYQEQPSQDGKVWLVLLTLAGLVAFGLYLTF